MRPGSKRGYHTTRVGVFLFRQPHRGAAEKMFNERLPSRVEIEQAAGPGCLGLAGANARDAGRKPARTGRV